MAPGNIADRHAWLHRLSHDRNLLLRRKAAPASAAGNHFDLENVSDIGASLGLSLGVCSRSVGESAKLIPAFREGLWARYVTAPPRPRCGMG